ncbi:MAG: hypothetical protein ABL872_19875, partial [Lacibacter sp.]
MLYQQTKEKRCLTVSLFCFTPAGVHKKKTHRCSVFFTKQHSGIIDIVYKQAAALSLKFLWDQASG